MFFFGGAVTGCVPIGGVLKPEELWNIDTKMDDGKPAQGKIWARSTGVWSAADACTTSASITDYAGNYRLSNAAPSCSIMTVNAL